LKSLLVTTSYEELLARQDSGAPSVTSLSWPDTTSYTALRNGIRKHFIRA